jgi:hypothetical protein
MANDGLGSLSSTSRIKRFAIALIALLLLLVGFWPSFETIAPPMDEGLLLVYPELVSHGQIPYRDFETFYGPANPYFLAGAFQLFGAHIFTERGVGLLYRTVVGVAIFGIARRWGTLIGTGGMLIAGALLICTDLVASAWIGGIGCVLGSLWVISSSHRGPRYFLAGCLGGLALLFRPDLGPAVILSALPFLWRTPWRSRGHYFVGLALALLPLAIVTLLAGIGNVWDNLFFYPVLVSNPGRRLPLFSAAPFVVRLLFLHLITGIVILASAALELRKNRGSVRGLLLFSVAILALALTPQAMQRLDTAHVLCVAIVSLPFLPVALASLFPETKSAPRNKAMATGVVLGTIVLIGITAPKITTRVRNGYAFGFGFSSGGTATFVEHNGRAFPFTSAEAAKTAAQLFQKLQAVSKPGERLFVGPGDLRRTNYSDTFIYHLFPQLHPASYFLEMNPFSANRPHTRLTADVSSADWLVLDEVMDKWQEPNRSSEFGDDAPNQVVLTEFTPIGKFGQYVLFRKATSEKPR